YHQAGIARLELQRSVDAPTEDDGTGAAVALRAAFLGSGEMGTGAKPVEHRHARRRAILAAWRSVQQEPHRGHARLFSHHGGGNRGMLEHVPCRLKTAAPRAWRGPTVANALIRFGRNALYNDGQDFCYTTRAARGIGRHADRY